MKWILLFLAVALSQGNCDILDHLRRLDDKSPVQSIRNIDYIYVINLDRRQEKYQQTLEQLLPHQIVPYRFSAIDGWKLPIEALWDVGFVFRKGMRPGAMATVYRIEEGKEYVSHEIVEVEGTHYLCHCMARGALGCVLSHLNVIQDALQSGYEIVWILEDDIEVVRDPHLLSQYIDELDRLVGRNHWDLLFTFRDYRIGEKEYSRAYGAAHRPDVDTRNQAAFTIDKPVSPNLRRVGSRFGTQSMIWTKNGMKKVLEYYKKYKIFLPYDLDLCLIPTIRIYSVVDDVVTNKLNSITDLGSRND